VTSILAVALLIALAGCTPGPNPLAGSFPGRGEAGFWMGLWHGMICPIVLVVSFFHRSMTIYEVNNSGVLYNAGFVLGAGAWGILGGGRAKK
jgi:hypothetical protein